ncbi:creatininase family protein [Phenylobacterium aquaticum]|uniref:creatininase family protein n=1 Tax=Phenylobacterium aquaticum TaxID=1763816 RepID=UPI001F5CA187|nr:creatininase family protein [Phenylobacterium aquaticum]MCI3131977.1 creatininase family protein [Phenylobacterium aquaticum]
MSGRIWLGALAALTLASGPAHAAPAPASVYMEDLTMPELQARLAAGKPVALIYSGGTEATGPSVAYGKHSARVHAYAGEIARQLGDAIVTPVLPFAPNADKLRNVGATITLTPETFTAVNEQVARSLIGGGFKRIALLSDHGPSQAPLKALAEKLDAEFAPKGVRVFFVSDSYTRARSEIEAEIRATGHTAGGHGGLWDTAETLAVAPALVRTDTLHPGDLTEEGNGPLSPEGFSGDPRGATAALGRKFGALRIKLAVEELKRDLAQADAAK